MAFDQAAAGCAAWHGAHGGFVICGTVFDMAQSLRKAGIKSASNLRELGADQAYIALLHSGVSPHFIMYYVLHMALQGRAWNDCKGAEKVKLRASFDQICNDHHDPDHSEFERQMDILGLRAK